MTEYNLTPPTILPSLEAQEAREKRRRVLNAVYQRRKQSYLRFRERMQKQEAATACNNDYPL